MHAFEYHRPASSKDAVSLVSKKPEGRYLAGGQSLVQAMKLRLSSPSDLIDLSALKDLTGIRTSGSTVEIGAMARHAEVAGSAEVKKAIPALAALAGTIGDRQVRHMGTLGGSLANDDPAADYPAAALGLGATIHTNKRKIEADKFFKGLYETALEPGELITSVSFPVPKRAAYMKFKNPASRFAMVGVFVADFGGKARVAVTGAGPSVFRQAEMEKALSAKFAPDSVAGIKVKPDGLNSDLHASPEYRAHLITVMARRAVEAALK
ncbi:MAG: carbon monoxide dehydrogenase [Betaproteobacteria bacterium RIFCSPLOWO2_12_FULL_68_19]|nr:MAG: carbon monoxide dehydrogenase [Betaproteobacteria bacterium RIFCSPLOWO2_12_FULL_68_19]